MTILAIDQGTTSTRAVEVREDGAMRVVCAVAHRQLRPRPGWVEHDPEELLASVVACLGASAEAEAVGLANQGESCLAWDEADGRPISPVIVWQDERTTGETERLRAEGAEALTLRRAGLPLDPYFSASKLGWILRNVPQARDLARRGRLRLGTTDAWFRRRLTGRCATDASTASRTSLMNLATCAWDPDLCALFGVPMEALPEIGPTAGDLGGIAGRRLAASVVDQQAALAGHGCGAPGDAKITFGTGAFVLAIAGAAVPEAGRGPLPTVAWRRCGEAPVYALEGGVYAAAAALDWARDLGLFSDFDAIGAFDAPPAVSRGLVFVPALAGLACPHWDRRAKGAWMGMGLDAGARDLVQSVLEGVAFRTTEVLRAMDAHSPLSETLSIDGGMSRNPWFCQFLADASGKRLMVSREPELTALGTARLAAAGCGRRIDPAVGGRIVEPQGQPPEWFGAFEDAVRLIRAYGNRGSTGGGW